MGITLTSLEEFLSETAYEARDLDLLPMWLQALERTANVLLTPKGWKIQE